MEKYYTICLGKDIWENLIDDINTTEIWAKGGMIWKSKKKAVACMNNLKKYEVETNKNKLSIKVLTFLKK